MAILGSDGAEAKILLPEVAGIEREEVDADFEYWTKEWLDDDMDVKVVYGERVTAWYLRDSNDNLYNMNDYEFPYGSGLVVDCIDDDAALIFSGSVRKDEFSVTLGSNYNFIGNSTPRTITLKEITVNENYANSVLAILGSDGAEAKILLPEVAGIEREEVDADFEYWTKEWLDDDMDIKVVYGERVTGWYLRDSNDNLFNMNDYELAPGAGLVVDCIDDEPEIVFPEGY